jgi:hypothetical protein
MERPITFMPGQTIRHPPLSVPLYRNSKYFVILWPYSLCERCRRCAFPLSAHIDYKQSIDQATCGNHITPFIIALPP